MPAFENEIAPNSATNHQGRLAYLSDDLLGKEVTGPIFEKAQEESLLLRLGGTVKVTYGETVIPVSGQEPEAGQVGVGKTNAQREGYAKPTSGFGWNSKSLRPIKLAVIVTASEEFARTDPQGMFTDLQPRLSRAIARACDLAVFHGKSPLTGGALAGIDAADVLANTTNYVEVNPATDDVVTKLLAGYDMVAADHEFNAFAVDPRYRTTLAAAMRSTDVNGNQTNPGAVNLAATSGELLGLRAEYGRAVGGDLGAATDSTIRAFGGDFTQLKYGFADEIRFKLTDQATLVDADGDVISLWQTNQVAVLCEVTFGWIVGDLDAFVKYGPDFTP
jgi:capsid protein